MFAFNPDTEESYKYNPATKVWDPYTPVFSKKAQNEETGELFGYDDNLQTWITVKNPDGEFKKGLKRGLDTSAALLTEAAPALAQSAANRVLQKTGIVDEPLFDIKDNAKAFQSKVQKSYQQNPPSVPSFTDIENLGDVGDYVAGGLGEVAPSIAQAMMGGGAGAILAQKAIKKAALKAGRQLTEKEATDFLSRGALLGATAVSTPANMGETYMNLLSEGRDAPGTAVIVGTLKSSLEGLTEVQALRKVFGPAIDDSIVKSLIKRTGVEFGKGAVTEGVTEAGQEALDIIAEKFILDHEDVFSKDNVIRLIDSGLKGAIGGGVVTGAMAPFMKTPQSETDKVTLDEAVVTPEYVDDATVAEAKTSGFNVESLSKLGKEQVDFVKDKIFKAKQPTKGPELDIQDVGSVDVVAPQAPLDDFVGTGEINTGSPVNTETATIADPLGQVSVTDNTQLEMSLDKPVTSKILPRELASAKPRFNTSTLSFPSDLEKALYVVAGQKTRSKRDGEYRQWLKDNYNMTDPQINLYGNQYKKAITDTAKTMGKDVEQIAAPEFKIPEAPVSTKKVTQGKKAKTSKWPVNVGDKVSWANSPTEGKLYEVTDVSGDGIVTFKDPETQQLNDDGVEQFTKPKMQKTILPAYGNARDDLVTPLQIAKDIEAVPLTDKYYENHPGIVEEAQRIVKEMTGGRAKLTAVDSIKTSLSNNPVLGLQFNNLIYAAVSPQFSETVHHELWHFFETQGLVSESDLAIIDNNTDLLKKYFFDDPFLMSEFDFDLMTADPEMRQELRANAFGKFAAEYRANQTNALKNIPGPFRGVYLKGLNLIRKLKAALSAKDIKTAEDVFTDIAQGSLANKAANQTNKLARTQRMSDTIRMQNSLNLESKEVDRLQEAIDASNDQYRTSGRGMGYFGRYLRSIVDLASKSPIAAQVYQAIDTTYKRGNMMLTNYVNDMGSYQAADPETRNTIANLADKLRTMGVTAVADEQGYLTWEHEGRKYKLNNLDHSRKFLELQKAFQRAFNDRLNIVQDLFFDAHKDIFPEIIALRGYKPSQIEEFLNSLPEDTPKSKINAVQDLLDTMTNANQQRNRAYAPHMRFGSFAFAVQDLEGNPVDLYTVEKGLGTKAYNEFQIKETIQRIKDDGYADPTKYRIVGNKTIKNLSEENMIPFKLSYNNIKSRMDPKLINLDLLVSLIQSKDMDIKDVEQVRNELLSDIALKGMARMFERDNNTKGYSKDWNRVVPAYFTGMSHYLAKMEGKKNLSQIASSLSELDDDVLRTKLEKYIEYNTSPQEEFQALRTFNFLWTMGGNISTALLQTVTLPTTTLGTMSMYNPNVWQNMKIIGKNMKLATTIFSEAPADLVAIDGTVAINYGDSDFISQQIQKGRMTEEKALFAQKANAIGAIKGLLSEQSLGFVNFESRDMMGKVKAKTNTISHLLGVPVSVAEQTTRFATAMSAYDIATMPGVLDQANKVLAKDNRWQAFKADKNKTYLTEQEKFALFIMDEAHAVFGKLGRVEYQRSIGGALVFPFMTYPHQMLELMGRLYGRGVDGRRGLMVTLTALFLISGLMGLPGAEMLKEMLEALEKQFTGSEEDIDLLIREKMYAMTGSPTFGKFLTQGVGRSLFGMDISKRVGLPVPGQEIAFAMTGVRGDATSILGVQGSLITSLATAFKEWNSDSGVVPVAAALTPVAFANLLKAYQYTEDGVDTQRGTKLLTADEVTAKTVISRALGVTTDQIATQREKQYYKLLLENKHKPKVDSFREQAKDAKAKEMRAQKKGDFTEVKKQQERRKEVYQKLVDYHREHEMPIDLIAFNRSVVKDALQRNDPAMKLKDVRKAARKEVSKMLEVLGTE